MDVWQSGFLVGLLVGSGLVAWIASSIFAKEARDKKTTEPTETQTP